MPRCRARKTERGKWSSDELKAAIGAVKAGIPIRQAATASNIPFSTIQQRLKTGDNSSEPRMGRKPVFTTAQEAALADTLIKLAKVFYGQTPLQVRCAAFEFAKRHNIPNNFNKEKRCAGVDWFYGFQARNPSIRVRKPEATSLNRVIAFNPEAVKMFFDNLRIVMDKYNFSPSQIWNMDETGITTVQQPQTVIAAKGQKRLGAMTSGERGRTITVVCAVSAAGSFIPPMFIFPRQRMASGLSTDGPIGAIYHCSKNGWTTAELFLVWLKHFVENSTCSKEKPVLLVLDNHASHISLEAYEFCRDHGIVMVSLPPHTSHRLQPLDVTFFGPFKAAFRKESDNMMKSEPLRKITEYDLASLFRKAYVKVASIEKGISGFSSTGICPLNPNIIPQEDFAAALLLRSINSNPLSNENITPEEDFVAASPLRPINSNLLSNENITPKILQQKEPSQTAIYDDTLISPSIIADAAFNIDELPMFLVDSCDETSGNFGLGGEEILFAHVSTSTAGEEKILFDCGSTSTMMAGKTLLNTKRTSPIVEPTVSPLPNMSDIAPCLLPKENMPPQNSVPKRAGRKKQQSIIITTSPMRIRRIRSKAEENN